MEDENYADCVFIRNVCSAGKSSYEDGCRACKKRYCLRGGKCSFYKSSAKYFLDLDGYAERKGMYD